MYHEGNWYRKGYYDTIEEMPNMAKVFFPDEKEPKQMTAEEICALDDQQWYTIMHSVNMGICDHWISQKPSKWVRERFERIIHYVDDNQNTVGYDRQEWSIRLTRDGKYWKSEVWNS